MKIRDSLVPITDLLESIVDNRGKSVPTQEKGFPLIATNCIKHSSIYPTFDKIRYISENTLENWFRAHLKPNDILFVNKGTPGRVCLVPDPVNFCAAQDMMAFRVDENKIYYKYLFAVLRSDWIQKKISNYHVGLVIPHFKKQNLNSILIPLKGKIEQKTIGDIYVGISEKIEVNNKINQELEAMAKTLYDYWFVQFDFPFDFAQGKPDANGLPYKSSGGKMVYNAELKREIPEGWEVAYLSEMTSFLSRGISPKYVEEGGVCVINQKCVRQGTVLFEQARRNNEDQRDSSKKRIQVNDILVNSTGVGTLGRVSMVRRLPEEIITVDSHVTIVRANENLINKIFFSYNLLQKQIEIERFSLGSTGQVELSRFQLESLKIIVPTKELQLQLEIFYKPICIQISNNEVQNQKLSALRDWLLPMLMNGQVTVCEAEEQLGMVAEENVKYEK